MQLGDFYTSGTLFGEFGSGVVSSQPDTVHCLMLRLLMADAIQVAAAAAATMHARYFFAWLCHLLLMLLAMLGFCLCHLCC